MSEATIRQLLDEWRSAERAVANAQPPDRSGLEEHAERAHQAYLDAVDEAAKTRRARGSRSRVEASDTVGD